MGGVTTLTVDILEELARDTRRALTINEIAKHIGKAYPNTHSTVTTLIEKGVLNREVVGHSHRCQLNLESPETSLLISYLQACKLREEMQRNPQIAKIITQLKEQHIQLAWLDEAGVHVIANHKTQWITHSITELPYLLPLLGAKLILVGHAQYAEFLLEVEQ